MLIIFIMHTNDFVICSFTFYSILEYYKMYKNKELYNWGDKDVGDVEYNPILKRAIIEPINSYTSFMYLITLSKYRDTIFNLLQSISIINLSLGSFFFHGTSTRYGLYLDYNAINLYLFNLILKDYFIMKYITNVNIIKKVFPCIFLFCRLLLSQLIKKNVTYYNNIYLFQFTILDLLLNAKVVNEIVKLNNNDKKKSSLCFIFWFIFNESDIIWGKNLTFNGKKIYLNHGLKKK